MGGETTERRGREEESDEEETSVGRIRFVVRALKYGWENRDEDDDSGIKYTRVEFHMVDLDVKSGTIELRRDVLPSLLARGTGGVLISLAPSSFSVFGGLSRRIDESLAASLKPPPERCHLYYKGAATLNLLGDGEWQAFPFQSRKYNAYRTICAVLSGKLYNFGFNSLRPEVFDPSLGYWTRFRFPPHLAYTRPSNPVVADPSNHRILVHSEPLSHLYAFYPDEVEDPHPDYSEEEDSRLRPNLPAPGGRWERLKPDYLSWADVVAVDGGLLFLYEYYNIRVYDLSSGDMLDVVSPPMPAHVNVPNIAFTSLFPLGNGFMCFTLADSKPPPDTIIVLLIVRAHRSSSVHSTSITLTPISSHSKTIESTSDLLDFLPLSQEAFEILGRKLAHNLVE